ncbi:hypothetical protein VP1G_01379 [Cytospora mali]|uniref:Glycoprotease family protein n=1 Tax=Cytospora mali TaxID=578113 RepID=A0A194UQM4_CYTMA|nr:hypothetical protein VP1G_01379 [Valsa mali var. pyri (nom. inval.)]
MEDLRSIHNAMAKNPFDHGNEKEEWEDWTDEEPHTASSAKLPSSKTYRPTTNRSSKLRQSNPKIQRLRSRKRQQAQNAKAGIRLVTDMTRFRKGPQHIAQLVKPAPDRDASQETAAKFVDANALRALEGSPSSASVGNWAWLKNSPSSASMAAPKGNAATPDDSKIIIGFSFPEGDSGRDISSQTAVVATSMNRLATNQPSTNPFYNQQVKSAWSPDTEDGLSPSRHLQIASSIYSQSTGFPGASEAPPVPVVPAPFKNPIKARLSKNDVDDDDNFTPVTLFEEDGHKSPGSAASKISPETIYSRSGWWDHIKTPFRERFSPTSKIDNEASTPSADEWWKGTDEKNTLQVPQSRNEPTSDASRSSEMLRPIPSTVPVIRLPTPTIASSSRSPPTIPDNQSQSEKARVMLEENESPTEMPPPYEREPSSKVAPPVKYRPVFPPEHPLASQFPPSPQPASPGLDGTMASQGGINMTDVPLTPAAPLPERAAGTFVPREQFLNVHGKSPAAKVERTRRRHEKEEYYARRAGGFWKGRACFDGCYGRAGREGRQRRRVWLWVCLAVFLLLVTLGVVLGIELSRRATGATHDAAPASASATGSSSSTESVWLNLTNFPPIPTGLATVVAPDNSEAVDGCAAPSTLWSCSLPPEQQADNEPHDANQPEFVLQIQYDNSTRQLWDIPNGTPPTPSGSINKVTSTTRVSTTATSVAHTSTKGTSTTGTSSAASATSTDSDGSSLTSPSSNELVTDSDSTLDRRSSTLYDTGIAPNPVPPSFDEMWFLGNTTDGIVSDEKAGEPTPFYISFFKNASSSAGPNMLPGTDASNTKRGTGNGIGSGTDSSDNLTQYLPAPLLNEDGTGAPAQLRPYPFQQPLRLFDRGLPTEHYGFYVYFNKTIYLESMDNDTASSDSNGGSRETNANWLASWQETRFIVKIWTQKGNTTRLMGGSGPSEKVSETTMPGTFPYPITIGEDTHGGDVNLKRFFAYGVEADQHINTTEAKLFNNDIGYGGNVINPRLPSGDLSWGGIDGGTGGCKCEWVNWVNNDGSTDESLT